jgi:hypothetical protein
MYSENSGKVKIMEFIPYTSHLATGVRSPAEAKDFSSTLCIQTSSEIHPTSYQIGTEGSFTGGKAQPGRDADHSSPSSAVVSNEQELYSCPPWRLHGGSGTSYLLAYLHVISRNVRVNMKTQGKCNIFPVFN